MAEVAEEAHLRTFTLRSSSYYYLLLLFVIIIILWCVVLSILLLIIIYYYYLLLLSSYGVWCMSTSRDEKRPWKLKMKSARTASVSLFLAKKLDSQSFSGFYFFVSKVAFHPGTLIWWPLNCAPWLMANCNANSQTLTAHIFIIFYWILTVFLFISKG